MKKLGYLLMAFITLQKTLVGGEKSFCLKEESGGCECFKGGIKSKVPPGPSCIENQLCVVADLTNSTCKKLLGHQDICKEKDGCYCYKKGLNNYDQCSENGICDIDDSYPYCIHKFVTTNELCTEFLCMCYPPLSEDLKYKGLSLRLEINDGCSLTSSGLKSLSVIKLTQLCFDSCRGCLCIYSDKMLRKWPQKANKSIECKEGEVCGTDDQNELICKKKVIYNEDQCQLGNCVCGSKNDDFDSETSCLKGDTCYYSKGKSKCVPETFISQTEICKESTGCLCKNSDKILEYLICNQGDLCIINFRKHVVCASPFEPKKMN